MGEHAAGDLIAVVHGHGVAHVRQEVCTAQAGRACADDRDLLLVILGGQSLGAAGRDVAGLFIELLLGDELLYLVDCNGSVNAASGAGVLAAAVADVAADGGERVLFFDKLERVHVAAFSSHADIDLDGNMRGQLLLQGAVPVS